MCADGFGLYDGGYGTGKLLLLPAEASADSAQRSFVVIHVFCAEEQRVRHAPAGHAAIPEERRDESRDVGDRRRDRRTLDLEPRDEHEVQGDRQAQGDESRVHVVPDVALAE